MCFLEGDKEYLGKDSRLTEYANRGAIYIVNSLNQMKLKMLCQVFYP